MSKKGKIAIIISSIIILIIVGFSITRSIKNAVVALKYCDTQFMNDNPDKFLWLFDSSKWSTIKYEYAIGNTGIEKYRFVYSCENKYRYVIFTDSGINSVDLKKIKDSLNNNAFKVDAPSENNAFRNGGHFEYDSKMCIDSSNELVLNIGTNVKLEKTTTSNSIQFKGVFHQTAIQNENVQTEYLMRFNKPTLTTLVFYKPKNILYMILINSFENKEQDNDGTNFLNLK